MIFCILSVLAVAAAVFMFVYLGWLWGLVTVIAAAGFFGLCRLFRNLQQKEEFKTNPPPQEGDFITGKVENNASTPDKPEKTNNPDKPDKHE